MGRASQHNIYHYISIFRKAFLEHLPKRPYQKTFGFIVPKHVGIIQLETLLIETEPARPDLKLFRGCEWVVACKTKRRPSSQFIENNARAPVGHRRGQEGAVVRARGARGGAPLISATSGLRLRCALRNMY